MASGATQHVFLRMDQPEDGWVYKTPAVMDALLPSSPSVSRLAPTGGSKRLVHSLLYRIPRGLWRRLHAERCAVARVGFPSGSRLAQGYVRLANQLFSLHLRRSRMAAFRRMLQVHRVLAAVDPDADVMLPWRELPYVRAMLHAGGARRPYRGPILMQRRADVFFDRPEGLERFDWGQLIRIQHRLWRHGVALADVAGALGPQGWALLGNRLFLADTGSLTKDFRLAMRVLSPDVMESRQQRQLRRQTDPALHERARAYYAQIRALINQDRLAALWCSALPGQAQDGR